MEHTFGGQTGLRQVEVQMALKELVGDRTVQSRADQITLLVTKLQWTLSGSVTILPCTTRRLLRVRYATYHFTCDVCKSIATLTHVR